MSSTLYTSPKRKRNTVHRSSKKSSLVKQDSTVPSREMNNLDYEEESGEDTPPSLFFSPAPIRTRTEGRTLYLLSVS